MLHAKRWPKLALLMMALTMGTTLLTLHRPLMSSHAAPALNQLVTGTTHGDWTRYLFSDLHQGYNPYETKINKSNVATLTVKWKFSANGASPHLVGEPIIVNGIVYMGSWNGYLYALNASNGGLIWKTNLGVYRTSVCTPPNGHPRGGPSGAAVFDRGMVFVGSGPHFYALNAATGAIIWQHVLGTSGTDSDHIWGSAAIANGRVYIGVASLCDHPLTQGIVYSLDETSGTILAQADIVPNGQIGGGVWSTPTIDAATGTLIVTTGSISPPNIQPMEAAVVTLNWKTLAVKQFWQVPAAQRIVDADFGSTPTLFPGPNGKTYFGCINKNTIYYVFDEANVSAGPVWEKKLGPGGSHGGVTGSIASSAYLNGILYIPTSVATVNGTQFQGSVGAFDALTGRPIWRFGTAGYYSGSVVIANGLLYGSQGSTFEARDLATGNVLFSYGSMDAIRASATIAHGMVYLPLFQSTLLVFGLGS